MSGMRAFSRAAGLPKALVNASASVEADFGASDADAGEPEPETWTIEAAHELGNFQGSPGFFGNSKDSEIYLDNVSGEAVK
ncbi:MAG: hypothetical protein ACKOTB_04940 [Planctomycetia bacterium]